MSNSKKFVGPFSFCPKHNVFYKSCKCPIPGMKKETAKASVTEPIEFGDSNDE